jgi:hypothetical protein
MLASELSGESGMAMRFYSQVAGNGRGERDVEREEGKGGMMAIRVDQRHHRARNQLPSSRRVDGIKT